MNIKKYVSYLIILIIVLTQIVQADNLELDKNAAIYSAIANSLELMQQEQTQNSNAKALKNNKLYYEYLHNRTVPMIDRISSLKSLDYLTPDEQVELGYLMRVIYLPLSSVDKLTLSYELETTISDLEYYIYSNNNYQHSIKNRIAQNVNASYVSLAKLERAIQLQNEILNNYKLTYNNAKLKLQRGFISQHEYKTIESKVKIKQKELNKLSYQNEAAIHKLEKLIGTKIKDYYNINLEDTYIDLELKSLDQYLEIAYKSNPDLLSAERNYETKDKQYKAIKNIEEFRDKEELEAVKRSLDNALFDLENIRLDLRIQLLSSFRDVENKKLQLERLKTTMEYQESKYLEAKKKHDLGQLSELQLADAFANYLGSQISYNNAAADYSLAKTNLDDICGLKLY